MATRNHLYVISLARDPWSSAIARIRRVEIYAALGDRNKLDDERRILDEELLPAIVEIDFRITLGRTHLTFGDRDAAQLNLECAAILSRR